MKSWKHLCLAVGIIFIGAVIFSIASCAPKKIVEAAVQEERITELHEQLAALDMSEAEDQGEASESEQRRRRERRSELQAELGELETERQGGRRRQAETAAAEAEIAAVPETIQSAPAAASVSQSVSASQTQSAAAPRYNIGDTGPNGGLIFSNTGGKYKEITAPGKEAAMRQGVERYLQAEAELNRLYNTYKPTDEETTRFNQLVILKQNASSSWGVTEEMKIAAEAAEAEMPKLLEQINEKWRKVNEITAPLRDKAEAAAIAALPPEAPAGWRLATAPDLIDVYNALVRTGKTSFGSRLYWSSSILSYLPTKTSSGTDYRRRAVAFAPFETQPPFMFPGYQIILTGGGPTTTYNHVMDMADGAIIHAEYEVYEGTLYCGFRDETYKNFKVEDILIPFVREF